jgi:hypothetical protein
MSRWHEPVGGLVVDAPDLSRLTIRSAANLFRNLVAVGQSSSALWWPLLPPFGLELLPLGHSPHVEHLHLWPMRLSTTASQRRFVPLRCRMRALLRGQNGLYEDRCCCAMPPSSANLRASPLRGLARFIYRTTSRAR